MSETAQVHHAPRVLIAAGGTAGHLAPALAVANELRERGCHVVFATSSGRGDERTVGEQGYETHTFAISGLPRRIGFPQIRAVAVAFVAVFRCARIVRSVRADVVLAAGGFVSVPVAIAARMFGVPVVVTEADAHLGLANRISASVAQRLCTAYPLPSHRRRQQVTGRPVAEAFFSTDAVAARQKFGLPETGRVVAVVGGSGGATQLNDAAAAAWAGLTDPTAGGEPLHILHVAGRRDFATYAEQTRDSSERYHLIEYCADMPELLAAADLVVSRAGGSIFELAAVGRAALLVPFPFATGDHQTQNAEWFASRGGAVVIDDGGLDGDHLRSLVDDLLGPGGDQRRADLAQRMATLARPHAVRDIADVVYQLGARRSRRRSSASTELELQPLHGRRFHMLGIGGAGVSALAQLCHAWGAEVSGCDRSDSMYAGLVREAGIEVATQHDATHIEAGMTVVVSSALPTDHEELQRARALNCPVMLRGELLGELTRLRTSVVIAGAHGKSSTTGMIVHAALRQGLDPAAAAGAVMADPVASNVRVGSGPFIVEGDESDRTLLSLSADVAVVTNIERDHHHTFASEDDVQQLFEQWVAGLADDAVLIAGPGPRLDQLAATASCRVVRFGDDEAALQHIADEISVPGRHNALNAAAAIAVLRELGSTDGDALATLADFPGVGRRFQRIGEVDGVLVVDDYAHHPTEVAAAIEAAHQLAEARLGRVHVVFQPHLFSRTQALSSEFAAALDTADVAWVLPIYGAREQPIDGVDAELIVNACLKHRDSVIGGLLPIDPATGAVDTILSNVVSGDIVMTMGAGNITLLAPRLVAHLTESRGQQ